jgi:hypothetical protein
VKWLGEARREEAQQVGGGAEAVGGVDFDEALVFNDVVAIAPASSAAVARVAVVFD